MVDVFGKELRKFDLVMVIYQRIDGSTLTLKKAVITDVIPPSEQEYGSIYYTYGRDSESVMFSDECCKLMIKIDDENGKIFNH